MSPVEIITLILIGLLAGVTGGMLGIGGSIVMIPAMTVLLGPAQHLYQAAAMIVNLFVVIPAVTQHRRAGVIDFAMVRRLAPLAIIGVVVGVLLSELPIFVGRNEANLRLLFGLFLFYVAASDLLSLWRRKAGGDAPASPNAPPTQPARSWGMAAAIALPTGFIGGLLGVGGGIVAVPLQRRLLGLPTRVAIANSAATIIAVASVGATMKNYALVTAHGYTYESFLLALVLIPTAIVGSLIGARLTHKLPVPIIKAAFAILLIIASARISVGAWHDIKAITSSAPASAISAPAPADTPTSPHP